MAKAKLRVIQVAVPESVYQLMHSERCLSADGRSFDPILLRWRAKAVQFRASLQGAVPREEEK